MLLLAVTAGCHDCMCLENDFPDPPIIQPPPLDNHATTDVFVQAARAPELDVLVVIDADPASWDDFAEVLPGLLAGFDVIDPRWRVAFTTTALGSPEVGWLAPTGADGGRWLSREDLVEPTVDWTEAPTDPPFGATGASFLAIDTDPYGFRRPEAALQLIVVSREADATPDSVITFQDWTEWVGAEDVVVFAAVPDDEPLLDVVDTTGGVPWDPNDSLDPWVTQITLVSPLPTRRYHLSAIPVDGSVEVRVQDASGVTRYFAEATGDPPVGDWTFDTAPNAVRFLEYVPEEGALVVANYAPLGDFIPDATP